MTAYIVRRLLFVVPLVLGVALIVFLVFDSGVLGDPVSKMAGKYAKPETIERLRHDLGYDRPVHERFLNYLRALATLEFGRSHQYHTRITEMIARGMGPSLSLTLPAFLLATTVAVSLALGCAAFRGGVIDRVLLVAAVALMSVSALVYIIFGQYLIGYRFELVPVSGYERGPAAVGYLLLPVAIFVVLTIGPDLRFYRTALLEEVRQDYVRTAQAKGVSRRKILFVHVLRNGMIPILTRVVVELPFLFLGALLLERFFQIPGLGGITLIGVFTDDMPVVRAMTFIVAVLYIVANVVTDVAYTIVDPRVRLR